MFSIKINVFHEYEQVVLSGFVSNLQIANTTERWSHPKQLFKGRRPGQRYSTDTRCLHFFLECIKTDRRGELVQVSGMTEFESDVTLPLRAITDAARIWKKMGTI